MRHRGRRGVTLIELVVVITLLALIGSAILFALNTSVSTWDASNRHFLENRRTLGAQRTLERQLLGMMPVVTKCGGPNSTVLRGGESGMRFVTSYSLTEAGRGYPRIVEYSVMAAASGPGVRLLATEFPYTGPGETTCAALAGLTVGPGSFVLADRLLYCRIQYLVEPRPGQPAIWVTQFSGPVPPVAIRIDMAPLEPSASRLSAVPVVLRLPVTRDARVEYKDIDDE